jgi:hypothetical protein
MMLLRRAFPVGKVDRERSGYEGKLDGRQETGTQLVKKEMMLVAVREMG